MGILGHALGSSPFCRGTRGIHIHHACHMAARRSLKEDAAAAGVVPGNVKVLCSIAAAPYIHPFSCPVLRDALCTGSSLSGKHLLALHKAQLSLGSQRGNPGHRRGCQPFRVLHQAYHLSQQHCASIFSRAWMHPIAGRLNEKRLHREMCGNIGIQPNVWQGCKVPHPAVGLKRAQDGPCPRVSVILPVCKHDEGPSRLQHPVYLPQRVLICKPVEGLHATMHYDHTADVGGTSRSSACRSCILT